MTPPYRRVTSVNSDLPIQLSVNDFLLHLANPLALGIEHRNLVFHLDQGQAAESLLVKLVEHVLDLRDLSVQQRGTFVEMACGLSRAEVMHEHQAGYEVRIFAHGLAEQLA